MTVPFAAIYRSEDSRVITSGLGAERAYLLRQFQGLRIFEPWEQGADLVPALEKLRSAPGAIYSVQGQVHAEGTRVPTDAALQDLRTGEVIWSGTSNVPLTQGDLLDLRDQFAERIATELGQLYGPIGTDMAQRSAGIETASIEGYLCILRAFQHRRTFSGATYAPNLACLEGAVARDPEYSDAWAMLGWLHLDAGRYEYPGAASTE